MSYRYIPFRLLQSATLMVRGAEVFTAKESGVLRVDTNSPDPTLEGMTLDQTAPGARDPDTARCVEGILNKYPLSKFDVLELEFSNLNVTYVTFN